MPRPDLESLFLTQLPAVERILRALARRHALTRDAAEEFGAWTKLRLVENDYAILGKFRGESTIATYLSVVIAMLYREYRVQEWGRWRPSAAAKRGGGLAIRLELLTRRDRIPLAQAGEMLRTSGKTTLSDRELAALVSGFPERAPLRPVQTTGASLDAPALSRADEIVDAEGAEADAHAARRALADALQTLSEEEQTIVRLHFMNDMSVADIARGLALPQKPLYRRLEHALKTLRARLESSGISREHVRSMATELPS
jgi:RNA polymerase sigma factor for flagellar operon FliA